SFHTTAISTVFQGAVGHAYAFYSVAIDQNGTREADPAGPDASVKVVGSNLTLRPNGNTADVFDVAANAVVYSQAFANPSTLWFAGADGLDDPLTLDTLGLSLNLAGGIRFTGGTGGHDQLLLVGPGAGTVAYTPATGALSLPVAGAAQLGNVEGVLL